MLSGKICSSGEVLILKFSATVRGEWELGV